MKDIFVINEKDNVVVALKDLKKGYTIDCSKKKVALKEDIKMGHKIAISDIKNGENIIKYGFPIGHAIKDIEKGSWVHTHNVKTNLNGIKEYTYNKKCIKNKKEDKCLTFKGYRRKNGEVGIRNELWIVPTVGCVNGIADQIVKRFKNEEHITDADNINVLKHNYGCSQLGEDHVNTRTILIDAIKHPNAGGVLVLGLGCENNRMDVLKECLGKYDEERVKFLVCQETSDEVSEGAGILKELYSKMQEDKREDVPVSELKIGLKCGGSDGLSGITANPLLGKFSDFLVSQGGSTILAEVPEMFGAETILMERARNEEVFSKTVSLINDFKKYFISYNQPIYDNPSPGNKAGGITTLEDKALGCTQKSGTSEVCDVLKYGERLKTKGLNLLSTPGNDLVASSAEAAAGCQMVLFTTGRGTPFGSIVPTVKVSTNTRLYNLKSNWIDFNAGVLVEDDSMEEVLKRFIRYIIDVASGKYTNNEKNGIREIAIFKNGVTL